MPEHTSRYVGLGVGPAAYPTAVEQTPGSCQNLRSAPQKHPIANIARSRPAGNGASRRWPLTKCLSGTSRRSSRPGSASAFDGIFSGLENIAFALCSCAHHLNDRERRALVVGEHRSEEHMSEL